MRKIVLLATFFFLTPFVLILSFSLLIFISSQKNSLFSSGQPPKVAFAAIPSSNQAMFLDVKAVDARVEAVKNFFSLYKSPLAPYANNIILAADKYGLDYRLLPSIAMQESTLCKNLPKILEDSYNCWGFGIYAKKITKFNSFDQAIEIVTKTLANEYKNQGLKTPEEIMSKYTPSNSGNWASNVSMLMGKLSI